MSAGNEVLARLPWSDQAFADESIDAATERALEREGLFIELAARRQSEGDRTLADDLEQAARIALWDVDPARFRRSEVGYIRRTMLNAIQNEKYNQWRAAGKNARVEAADDGPGEGDEELGENDYQGMLARAFQDGDVFGVPRGIRSSLEKAETVREARRHRKAVRRRKKARRAKAARIAARAAEPAERGAEDHGRPHAA